MTSYTQTITENLKVQRLRYPLMNEEDVVKFAFQGMMGVGHLVASEESALARLTRETIITRVRTIVMTFFILKIPPMKFTPQAETFS